MNPLFFTDSINHLWHFIRRFIQNFDFILFPSGSVILLAHPISNFYMFQVHLLQLVQHFVRISIVVGRHLEK